MPRGGGWMIGQTGGVAVLCGQGRATPSFVRLWWSSSRGEALQLRSGSTNQ